MDKISISFFIVFFILEINPALAVDNLSKIDRLYSGVKKRYPSIPEVKIGELKALIKSKDKNFILVDVRSKRERLVSIIPGAISKENFEKNKAQYLNKKIIAYCTIGERSGRFLKKIRKNNYKGYNLEKSILGWIHSNGILVDEKKMETKNVHVYGKKWNLPPNGYKAVWSWWF